MGGILDKLDEWLRGLLIEGITGNLSGMFDTVNTKVGEIAGEVGQTPLAWNSGVFSMIRNLSETVIVPIAGVMLWISQRKAGVWHTTLHPNGYPGGIDPSKSAGDRVLRKNP